MMESEPQLTGIFKQLREKKFTTSHCFLCDKKLSEENQTVEHVIPKWLQNEFNLWNEKITLLNKTKLPYRQLTIPCCFDCNNRYLRPFEDKVLNAFSDGYEAFCNLDQNTLFLWLGKIYYGIMYKELFLSLNRENPESPTIISPEYIERFYMHLLFLQGIRGKHEFKNFFPASIFIFKTQKSDNSEACWDLIDNQMSLFIAIRMGGIGVLSVLQDGQALHQFLGKEYERYKTFELHPIQFKEIAAMTLCNAIRMNRTPKYINFQRDEYIETHQMPLQGLSSKPIFDDWDSDIFTNVLSWVTGLPEQIISPQEGKIQSWLHNEEFQPVFMSISDYPW